MLSLPIPEDKDWDDPDNNFYEITRVVNLALERAVQRLTEFLS